MLLGAAKPIPSTTTRLRDDEGTDAHDPAADVNERPATAAWIDGGVGLDIDHLIIGTNLARSFSWRQRQDSAECSSPSGLPNAITSCKGTSVLQSRLS